VFRSSSVPSPGAHVVDAGGFAPNSSATADALTSEGIAEDAESLRISRAALEADAMRMIIAKGAPHQTVLTDAEREASLSEILAHRPNGPLWIFAYGSLIWNPAIHAAERRIARIAGWHRAFCLSSSGGRGTPENPGLVLGLDEGGFCQGVALRISEADIAGELPLLWRREMVNGSYIPRWLPITGKDGRTFGHAIAFVINREGPNYAGDLPREVAVRRLATAVGGLGSSAEYLFRTREGLRDCGIPDEDLEHLAADVEAVQAGAQV
jgi:cation transport protein ChaC